MITIDDYYVNHLGYGFNKCITVEIPIRFLLNIKDGKVQDFSIVSPTNENDIGSFIADELEYKGIDIVLKLIKKLDNEKYNKLIEGT